MATKTLYINRTFENYKHPAPAMSVYMQDDEVTVREVGKPNSSDWTLIGSVIRLNGKTEWAYAYNSKPCAIKSNRLIAESAIKTYTARGGFPKGYVSLPLGYRLVADLYTDNQ